MTLEADNMFEKHEKEINENILPRLEAVEKAQAQFQKEVSTIKADLAGVQKGQAQLELTVMKDGQQTRDMLKRFVDHYFDQDHAEAQAEKDKLQAEKDLKLKRMEAREKVITGFFGVGGAAGILTAIAALVALFLQ